MRPPTGRWRIKHEVLEMTVISRTSELWDSLGLSAGHQEGEDRVGVPRGGILLSQLQLHVAGAVDLNSVHPPKSQTPCVSDS